MRARFDEHGFYLVENALGGEQVDELIQELSVFENQMNNYGVRDLMRKVPYVCQLATAAPLITIAREILGDRAKPVRSVFFDKVPGANWNVAWHQDTSVALKARHEVVGFGPWSEKQGVPHAEPPAEYLAGILTLRVHLDASNPENGGLRIVPGSHRGGRVGSQELVQIVETSAIIDCVASPGDVLVMSPLLFHSSRKSVAPSHRRIIHIEYSADDLPAPLEWHEVEPGRKERTA